jgi:DEAD/DEAH box helicase domain-containing protein
MAQFKSLMPKLIKFAYVDPAFLQVHAGNAPSKAAEKDAAFEIDHKPSGEPHVLLFEFNDGELKASNRGGKTVTRRWQNRDGQTTPIVPTFTASGMTRLIDKRNLKFTEAVNELLLACETQVRRVPPRPQACGTAVQGQDPVKLLLEATEDHVPVKPGSPGATPLRERRAGLDYFIQHPEFRPSIANIIQEMQDDEDYRNQIVDNGHRVVDAREAAFGASRVSVMASVPDAELADLDEPLSQAIMDALYDLKGIKQLYSHQAEAIKHLAKGNNVIVSTSTCALPHTARVGSLSAAQPRANPSSTSCPPFAPSSRISLAPRSTFFRPRHSPRIKSAPSPSSWPTANTSTA